MARAADRTIAKKAAEDSPSKIWQEGYSLLRSDGLDRRTRASNALFLYYGNNRHSFDATRSLLEEWLPFDPPGFNVIQAAVDTKTAHIVRNKVRPMFVTERGDSEMVERAKGLQRAVESVFFEVGIYGAEGVSVCRDGQLFEAGGMKFTPDAESGRVLGERVFAHEVLISDAEARYGHPRQMWHAHTVDRRVLLKRFADQPKAAELIERAEPAPIELINRSLVEANEVADQVVVLEYWRLPAGRVDASKREAFGRDKEGRLDPKIDPGHDGRHMMLLDGGALLDEPWPYDYFPIAWYKPLRHAVGYWSRSIPETLAGSQLLINRYNDRIDKIIRLHAVPRMVVSRAAKLSKAKLTNGLADVLEVNGPASQAVYLLQPNSIPAELLRRIDDITRWAEKQVGLSEMSLAARKPPGVDHAPGMQHLADTESIRHTTDFRSWEDFHVEAARMVVDCCRMLDQFGGVDQEFLWGNSKQLRRLKWSEVDMPADRYHLRVWPTNLLPMTPGARKSFVIDMVNAGLFNQKQAMSALDFPDVDALVGDTTATSENVDRVLEEARAGKRPVVHPYMDLELLRRRSIDTINRLEADGESDEAIEGVRRVFEDAERLLATPPPGAPPPDGAVPPPPEGAPPPLPPGAPPQGALPPEASM